MLEEFKKFAIKGNVIDLAVGIIIGGAFSKITTSFVNDILMPPIGQILGGANFKNFFYVFGNGTFTTIDEAKKAGYAVFAYGSFIQTIVDFLITAIAIFILVKIINKLRDQKKEEEKPKTPPTPSQEVLLLEEIRDLLKKNEP